MGSWVKVVVYCESADAATRALTAAFDEVARLDAIMSDYRPRSELMKLCDKAGTGPVRVSDDLLAILTKAQQIARQSGGAFDVTVGPCVRLWRQARKTGVMPDPDELARARTLIGYQLVELDEVARTVTLTRPGMRLDLGGIAKGDAADHALAVMADLGVTRALVDAGGDIALGDPPPGRDGWRVAIAGGGGTLVLTNTGIATSGDTEQFIEINGTRYSHIVDPRTGVGLTSRVQVTVIAPDAGSADALASAVSVLGPTDGLALLEHDPRASARIVQHAENGPRVFTSDRFSSGE